MQEKTILGVVIFHPYNLKNSYPADIRTFISQQVLIVIYTFLRFFGSADWKKVFMVEGMGKEGQLPFQCK